MKKILAGVLASASLLATTTGAFAASTDKKVTAAGEVEYDVAVTAPKVVLDLVLPAKISAALNPYGAEIKLEAVDGTTNVTTTGIASVAYPITNKSKDYGVWVDAKAVTTVATSDTTKWTVKACAGDGATKGAELSLVAANDITEFKGFADDLTTINYGKAVDNGGAAKQGALKLDSTVAADKTNGVAAGQTAEKKMMFVAANNGTNDGAGVLGFLGNVETGDDIEWTEDDAINVSLVLKISAGAKTIDGAASTPGASGPKFAAASDVAFTPGGGANAPTLAAGGAFAFDPATTTYTLNSDLDNTGGRFDLAVNDPTGATSTIAASGVLSYNSTNGRVTATGTGAGAVTITLTDDTDGTKTTTYTFNFTIS